MAEYLECEGGDYAGTGGEDPGAAETGSAYPDWEPGRHVRRDGVPDAYVVDKVLLEDIAADSSVLLKEDHARLYALPGGFFELRNIASNDLAHHLGFRNGDVVKSAGGVALRKTGDYIKAIVALGTTSHVTVVVQREGRSKVLKYRIQ